MSANEIEHQGNSAENNDNCKFKESIRGNVMNRIILSSISRGLSVILLISLDVFASTPSIVSVTPDTAIQGRVISVAITGQATNFVVGSGSSALNNVSSVWFSQGSSTIYADNFSASSATQLSAQFSIPLNAPMGTWDVNVLPVSAATLTLAGGMRIDAASYIVSVQPDSGMRGSSLTVTITGQNSGFATGSGSGTVNNVNGVWLSQGSSTINSTGVNVSGATSLTADFTIPPTITPGYWDVNVGEISGSLPPLVQGFRVVHSTDEPPAPQNLTAVGNGEEVTLTWDRVSDAHFLRYMIYYGTNSGSEILRDSTTGGLTDTSFVITGFTDRQNYTYFYVTSLDSSRLESPSSNEVNALAGVPVKITSVAPSYATPGQTLTVFITGQETIFESTSGSGTISYVSSVYLSLGASVVSASNFTPQSDTSLSAAFTIPFDAALGYWNINVLTTNTGLLTDSSAFRIDSASIVKSVSPDTGLRGTTLAVTITGQHSMFTTYSGSSTLNNVNSAWLSQGSSTIYFTDINVQNSTTLTSDVTIPSNALTGKWDVNVALDSGAVQPLSGGFVIIHNPLEPSPPRNLVALPDSAQVTLFWTANVDRDFLKYRIYSGTTSGGETLIDSTAPSSLDTMKQVTGLTNGKAYYFKVTALDSSYLESDYSNEVESYPIAPPPTISSFSPMKGPIDTTVTITGYRFSATPSNDVVFFGAVRAKVLSATTTKLEVGVPVGATYSPITVTVNGLTAYSEAPFSTTYTSIYTISDSSFDSEWSFMSGNAPIGVTLSDVNLDGKPDIVVASSQSSFVMLLKNTCDSGLFSLSSFEHGYEFGTGQDPLHVATADINGDGLPDIVVSNYMSQTVSVLRNSVVSNTITSSSFAQRTDLDAGGYVEGVAVADFDGDGKPDIVVAKYSDDSVAVFKNISTRDSIMFAPRVCFKTGNGPYGLAVGDIDGDGLPDIAAVNSTDGTLSILRNRGVRGIIDTNSFANQVVFPAGSLPQDVAIGDLDGDGKPDLVVSNTDSNTISLYKNMCVPGSITTSSFATHFSLQTGLGPVGIALGDIDGDGRLDIAVACTPGDSVYVYKNVSTAGQLREASFAPKVEFIVGGGPHYVVIGDLDGDGKPDLIVTCADVNGVSLLRNITHSIATQVKRPGQEILTTYALYQNFPNPFNPSTTIRFDLKQRSDVSLEIFNTLGQRVDIWTCRLLDAGKYDEVVDMSRFASGIYLYRITAVGKNGERFTSIKKLVLMK